jgi:flavin reductase (DIM6/NTAB) family NADH-FMN oxidoreductase RutF
MSTFRANDAEAYRALSRCWAATVNVVTSRRRADSNATDVPELDGFTCTSFTPVSIQPPLILVSVTNAASTLAIMRESACFAVNLLGPEQVAIGNAFAQAHSERPRIWQELSWEPDAAGAPLLAGTAGAFSAKVHKLIDAGDHTLVLGEVTEIHVSDQPDTLLYHNRAYGRFHRHG